MRDTETSKSFERHAAAEFDARLHALTPTTWGLYLLMGINTGVWLLNVVLGMDALKPAPAQLWRWGANSAWSVVNDGQYWRLLTATFLHGGIFHLALNMLALWSAGRQLSRLYGNAQFLAIYLASALAGSALSLHFSAQTSVSVGASGGVFGVLGALLVALLRHRRQMPALFNKNAIASQGLFLAYALVQGFGKEGIDNAAHVGGLLAGIGVAWLLPEQIDEAVTPARRRVRQQLAFGLASLAVAVLVAATPAPRINHEKAFENQAAIKHLMPQLQAAEQRLQNDIAARKAGRLSDAQLADALEHNHIPAYRRVHQAFQALDWTVGDTTPLLADARRQHSLMLEALELEVRRARGDGDMAAHERRLAALSVELKAVSQRLRAKAPQAAAPSN